MVSDKILRSLTIPVSEGEGLFPNARQLYVCHQRPRMSRLSLAVNCHAALTTVRHFDLRRGLFNQGQAICNSGMLGIERAMDLGLVSVVRYPGQRAVFADVVRLKTKLER